MPRTDYVSCWNCGGHRDEVGELSHTRLCLTCAEKILSENIAGLAAKDGVVWRRYVGGMARYVNRLQSERLQETH